MWKTYDIKITVDSVTKNKCNRGHKVGDSWLCKNGGTPDNMCATAYISMAALLRSMWLGQEQPWKEAEYINYRCCPDPEVMVIYKIERIER